MSTYEGYLGDLGKYAKIYRDSFVRVDDDATLLKILSNLYLYKDEVIKVLSCECDIFVSYYVEETKRWIS